jgi:hypothetical protein
MAKPKHPDPIAYPTPLEQQGLNPHGLDTGDTVILPDGSTATIYRAGFRFAKIVGTSKAYRLIDLRPHRPEEEGKPQVNQLSLL